MTPRIRRRGPAPRGAGRLLALLALPALAACSATGGTLACTAGEARGLPEALHESSGVAWSAADPALYWTVNDGGDGILHALDTTGAQLGSVATRGSRLRDVEDLAGAPCPEGYCLYLADTGDNGEGRPEVAIHRLPEPALDAATAERVAFPMRFPDGPRDVEALFVLPGERVFLVTKGRNHPPTLYRYPGTLRADTVVMLERLNAMGTRPASLASRITGASHVPGTEDRVLIRSYDALYLYRVTDAGMERVPEADVTLRPLQEAQGEAVAAHRDGRVLLTSEAGPVASRGTVRLLRCRYPDPASDG